MTISVAEGSLNQSQITSAGVVTSASGNAYVSGDGGDRTGSLLEQVGSCQDVALINGTQNFISWTAPNDGKKHFVVFTGTQNITTLEVGGATVINWTYGGLAQSTTLVAAATAASVKPLLNGFACDPNTAVTVAQSTALTGGAAKLSGMLLAA